MPDSRDQNPTMDDITINTDGVEKLLAGLNPTKASGLECIPPRVLKELAPEIAPLLTTIYNSSLQTGKVPQDWRDALLTKEFKKGEHHKASNYRPISLTSVTAKILEHILVSATSKRTFCLPNNMAFASSAPAGLSSWSLTKKVSSSMVSGIATDVIFMDFAKAFDRVNHSLLVHKLDHYGIRGCTNSWITSFLSERKQDVVVNGFQSSYASIKSGVPQGSVLGPSLFLTYINDLPKRISSPSRLFANDTAVYQVIACMPR